MMSLLFWRCCVFVSEILVAVVVSVFSTEYFRGSTMHFCFDDYLPIFHNIFCYLKILFSFFLFYEKITKLFCELLFPLL